MQIFWRCCAGARRMFYTAHSTRWPCMSVSAARRCFAPKQSGRRARRWNICPAPGFMWPTVRCVPAFFGRKQAVQADKSAVRHGICGLCRPRPCRAWNCAILDESHTDLVFEHYHMAPGRDYVAERLAAGAMTGAFLDGVLAGFIGIHEEGSIGMLEVLPAYRRRGLGYALEAGAIRRALKEGAIPYCQVIEGNTASMELQKKLGLEFSDGFVYWLF